MNGSFFGFGCVGLHGGERDVEVRRNGKKGDGGEQRRDRVGGVGGVRKNNGVT
jgi:hypothetical protein